jgi:hypothetical protein
MDLLLESEETSKDPEKPQRRGFFQRLLAIFSGSGDPESEKKKLLRQLGRDIPKARYKFYRPKGEEALPGLARFFYEIYKTVAPSQVLLNNTDGSASLKSYIIDSFLSPDQIDLVGKLAEDSIAEMAKTMNMKELQNQVKNVLVQVYSFFDTDKIKQIDDAYNTLLSFIRFAHFDYYFLLKKFDSNISERNFAYNPRFDTISGEYVAEDLKDFFEVFLGLNLAADWRAIFNGLKQYRNLDVINVEVWLKLANAMRDVRQSQILPMVVQHLDKDPYYTPTAVVSSEKIVDPYLQKLKAQTDVIVQKVVSEKRNSKVEELARIIFGTTAISRMKNYAEKANAAFAKKGLPGFIYIQPLNYLKAFLLDFFKKDVRELIDLLLIRGKWSTNLSSQMLSESFHSLMSASESLILFDDALADDGEAGARIRSAVAKADRDKEQVKYLRTLMTDANSKAASIINQAATALIAMGRTLKALIEDYDKSPHELIINWKEIDQASDAKAKRRMTEVYKKMYYFVQLMQYYVKEDSV